MRQNDRKCILAMPSLTFALSGESLLVGGGIFVRVIKLPSGATKKGCAYGLELNCPFLEEAVRRIEAAGIRHGEILR